MNSIGNDPDTMGTKIRKNTFTRFKFAKTHLDNVFLVILFDRFEFEYFDNTL